MLLENVCSAIARALPNTKCNASSAIFYERQAATEMASTNETSAQANPHNSFVILESFVEDAFVMEAFISGLRVISILNQRRGETWR